MKQLAILGAGSMGVAVAVLLGKNNYKVTMWTPFEDEASVINNVRELKDRLPGVIIPETVECTTDLEKAVTGADMVIMAVPSQTMRQNAKNISTYINDQTVILSCSKGIENETCLLLTDVIKQEISNAKVAAISGPSYAIEIAKGMPTAVVAACEDLKVAEYVQDIFMCDNFRVYTNSDVIGVELGGSLKNVIALCAGISDGLGLGDNTRSALITRGMAEIARLGVKMGAKKQTFAGLTGMGDLILTCSGQHSRNRKAGILIGRGKTLQQALDEVKMVVEGVSTTKPAFDLSKKYEIPMPIINEAYNVLFEGKSPRQAVYDLMTRDKKNELEDIVTESWI